MSSKLELILVNLSFQHSSSYPSHTPHHMAGSCVSVSGAAFPQAVEVRVGKKDHVFQISWICAVLLIAAAYDEVQEKR